MISTIILAIILALGFVSAEFPIKVLNNGVYGNYNSPINKIIKVVESLDINETDVS